MIANVEYRTLLLDGETWSEWARRYRTIFYSAKSTHFTKDSTWTNGIPQETVTRHLRRLQEAVEVHDQ